MAYNIGLTIYENNSSMEKTKGIMNMICVSIIGILMLICAWYLFTNPSNKVNGTAIASSNSLCNLLNNRTTCITQISYIINNKTFTGSIVDNTPHEKESIINISYDPNNPENVVARQLPSSILAICTAVIGCCLIGVGYFNYITPSKSQGSQTVLRL